MHRTLFALRVAFVVLAGVIPASAAGPVGPDAFTTEQEAKAHCKADTVVWLNLLTGVYHFAGQRWYGKTKDGVFVCKKEADADGERPTKNGQ